MEECNSVNSDVALSERGMLTYDWSLATMTVLIILQISF